MDLETFARMVHLTSKRHGFWQRHPIFFWRPKVGFVERLTLLHSEISEVLEAYRERKDDHIPEEMADILIRLLDICEGYRIPLVQAAIAKATVNDTRPYMHGNKRL